MLLIYNVDRRARRTPWCTYGLMALNTFIFLVTILVANFNLPVDRIQGEDHLKALLQNPTELRAQYREFVAFLRKNGVSMPNANPTDEEIDQALSELDETEKRELAANLSFLRASTSEGYQHHWQISHLDSKYVLEPHYSTTNLFAYRPSESVWWRKILGILGSMFLHGGVEHLLGNMLFLWVFGRALEDALGAIIYTGAYLVAGIAATLLFHIITMQFAPDTAGVPLMGASGAIAGLMGLFMVRFYRTPVRISPFVLVAFLGILVVLPILLLISVVLMGLLGIPLALVAFGYLVYQSRQWSWQGFKLPALWAMSGWLLVFDMRPALQEVFTGQHGGVAHWAHIGGFLFGAAYALAIGARDEGAAEYMLDDAQKAMSEGDAADALRRSQALLSGEQKGAHTAVPSMKAQAFEVQAGAYARQGNKDAALENYENAIMAYLADNDRDAAARVFLDALDHYPLFVLPAAKLLVIASHLAERGDAVKAAENLGKIPYCYPDAPESEIATLRAARLHLEKLDNPAHAAQLLQWFVARYPHSDWIQQAQRMLNAAQNRVQSP